MKKEQILDFTRRISQCNRSGLIVVMYDIYFVYLNGAKSAYEKGTWEEYKENLRKAQRMIDELISSLNFSYDLAKELYRIYVFCRDSLATALYRRDIGELVTAEELMRKLYTAFEQVAGTDKSGPLMSNTQQVYAGYTYGRDDLVETCQDSDTSRGLFA